MNAVLTELNRGVLHAADLRERLGVSPATLMRALREAGPDVVRIGRGRATRYGLRQSWQNLGASPLDPEVRRALVRSARRVTESVHLLAPAEALGRGRHLAPPLADLHRGTRRARAIAVGDGVHRRRGLLHRLSAGPAGMPYASALAPRVDGTDQGSHRSPPGGPGRSRQRAGVRERAAGSAGLMTRLPWADQPRK
jgi:hypothetical protein